MCTDLHKFVWMFQAKNINKYDIHWLYSVVSDGFCVVYTLEKDRSSKDRFFFFSTTFFFCMIKIEAMKNKKPFATILRNLIEISRLKIPAGYHLYLYQLWFFFNDHHYLSMLATATKSEGEAAHFHSRCCFCWMHILNLTSKYME